MPAPLAALRPRLPAPTARLRLTLLYAGLFLLLGTVAIATIVLFVRTGSAVRVAHPVPGPDLGPPPADAGAVQQRSADVSRLLAASWVVLASTAIAAALLGWFASGRVLRPLRVMTATARTISAGSLHQRLALTGPDDEIKQLGDTLDELLARLEASFEAQRRFVANASHELRTPLTVERTLLQVALADPNASTDKLRAICEELLASGREHERLLEALLTLASSERGVLERAVPLELSTLVRAALHTPKAGLHLTTSLHPAPITGDPALIERLIANLIDNAVEHNDDRGWVEITTAAAPEGALLTIANTGPAVPATEIQRLFEPFQRLGGRTAEADGHFGLGLSIARAIAGAHRALLTAEPRPDGGLVVAVRFTMVAGDPAVA